MVITSSEKTSAEKYLTILALGMTLQQLSQSNKRKFYILQYLFMTINFVISSATVGLKRKFSEGLKTGEPNLLVTPSGCVCTQNWKN